MKSFLYRLAQAKLSPNAAAQGVHFLLGFNAVFLTYHFGGSRLIAFVITELVAGIIEFWFDAKYEKQGFRDNILDFSVYTVGTVAAAIVSRL